MLLPAPAETAEGDAPSIELASAAVMAEAEAEEATEAEASRKVGDPLPVEPPAEPARGLKSADTAPAEEEEEEEEEGPAPRGVCGRAAKGPLTAGTAEGCGAAAAEVEPKRNAASCGCSADAEGVPEPTVTVPPWPALGTIAEGAAPAPWAGTATG